MEVAVKKSTKKTTSEQFGVLVQQMEKNPELARGVPVFGASKAKIDEKWSTIAMKVNSYGPPNRSVMEWKKIWADLKSRTKKKISENHKSIRETGGGPFRFNPLSEMEQTIDRIISISIAADPRGSDLGVLPSSQLSTQPCEQPTDFVAIVTPPRRTQPVGVVTPTRATSSTLMQQQSENAASHSKPMKRKRNALEEQLKLIRLELQNQQDSIVEFKKQNSIAQAQAESIKILAEAAKMQAEATNAIAVSTATQAEAVKDIAVAIGEVLNLLKTK